MGQRGQEEHRQVDRAERHQGDRAAYLRASEDSPDCQGFPVAPLRDFRAVQPFWYLHLQKMNHASAPRVGAARHTAHMDEL